VLTVVVALLLVALQAEHVVDVRVQGNTLTPDEVIVKLARVEPGTPFTPQTIDEVTKRVKAGGRFERVEVLKRYASIADPSQILLVIVVDEGRVTIRPAKDGEPARAVRRRVPPLMALPILGSDEGYGFTYGALVTIPKVAGSGSRLGVPLTWGGEHRMGAEFEKRFDTEQFTRLRVGGALLSRTSEALGATDNRQQLWVRAEREVVAPLRLGVWSQVDFVSFGGTDSRVIRTGLEAIVDTRVDPMLSRNAVNVRVAAERLAIEGGLTPLRTVIDASGYLGGPGTSIIVVRVFRDGVDQPLPPFLKVLRGRESTLRGFEAGTAAGDITAAGTIEVRMPINASLNIVKVGVRGFIDAATVYDVGEHLQDQRFDRGIGGGVFLTATVIRLSFDVAHASTGGTRVAVNSGLSF
jgi:outer membrane protein assembly factor BamA